MSQDLSLEPVNPDKSGFSDSDTAYRLLVGEEEQGERLDRVLALALSETGVSRERIQSLIRDGRVRVNDAVETKPSLRLKEYDAVEVRIPECKPLALEAESIPLAVCYEDEHLLVINKPRGMLTHPTGRERSGTLVNALLAHCGNRLSGINGIIRPGIVHRLDRDTSGLLMVAKTDRAHISLSEQIREKTARRDYRALVQGSFRADAGYVDAPIGRHPKNRDQMAVVPRGRMAITHWRVRERLGNKFALLDLSLETGRTHQIRVHMSHIGHPILGDPLYGSGIEKQLRLKTPGQLLQAVRLGLKHPITAEPMVFELPQEDELTQAWACLTERMS